MNKKGVIVCFILLCISSIGFAQDDLTCPEKLSEAKRRFEQGRFYSIPGLLEDCVKKNGLNEQQKIEAYFLLSQTYLFIDEPAKAEESYISILRIDPEFKPDEERAPIDQVYLSEKFTTRPIFVANARFGMNYTSVDVIQNFSTSPRPSIVEYDLSAGVEFSGGIDVVFSDFMSIGTGLGLVQKTYKYSQELFFEIEDDGERDLIDEQKMKESQWNIEVPLIARFRWRAGKFIPYVYAGASMNYTLSANADLELRNSVRDPNSNAPDEQVENGRAVNILPQRENLSWNYLLGGGVRIKSGYNFISVDLGYRGGLTNIVNKQTQFQNQELVFRYAYVDDYKKLNNMVLSVGYVKPFYKPRKKRKYRK